MVIALVVAAALLLLAAYELHRLAMLERKHRAALHVKR
jgi:hypothetical protein